MKLLSIHTLLPLFLLVFLRSQPASGQDMGDSTAQAGEKLKRWEWSGYLKDLQSIQFKDVHSKWTLDNLIHNRFDVHWYPTSRLKLHLGIRNRFIYGESAKLYQQQESLLSPDIGLFQLSSTLWKGESFLLHSEIDRALAEYTRGKWQFSLGRQRINWGLNLVWNPNDIFNAYSYFDFDYEERPGTDAIRVQHYLGSTSSVEMAYKPGKDPDRTIAAVLYRLTAGSYDWQVLGGWVNGDYALGGGWSGTLGQAGFNGEITGFLPHRNTSLDKTSLSASMGVNYTFANSLYLHGAYLYNSSGTNRPDSAQAGYFFQSVSAKFLSPSTHSVFGEIAYQLSPLVRGDVAAILNPGDGSFFCGPFFNFSVSNSSELLVGGQLFFGPGGSLYGGYGKVIFLRFKWSF